MQHKRTIEIVNNNDKSIKKSNKMYTLAKKGLMISLCGFLLTQVSRMSAEIIYTEKYDSFIKDIEKNPAVILKLNDEEEKAITAFQNEKISREEFETQLEEIKSDEYKLSTAKELDYENYNKKMNDIKHAETAKKVSEAASAVTSIGILGFAIARISTSAKKEIEEEYNREIF